MFKLYIDILLTNEFQFYNIYFIFYNNVNLFYENIFFYSLFHINKIYVR